MNKLDLTNLGGHPLKLDDLRILQAASIEAFSGILAGMQDSAGLGYILAGCELTAVSGEWHIGAGYVCLKLATAAEIYFVPSHNTGVSSSSTPYWKIVETVIAPSPTTYKNAASVNVHLQRRLTLSATSTLFIPAYSQTPTLVDVWKSRFKQAGDVIAPINNWIVGDADLPEPSYEIYGQTVRLKGAIKAPVVSTDPLPCLLLPEDIRPSYNVLASALVYEKSSGEFFTKGIHVGAITYGHVVPVLIKPNGEVIISGTIASVSGTRYPILIEGITWNL